MKKKQTKINLWKGAGREKWKRHKVSECYTILNTKSIWVQVDKPFHLYHGTLNSYILINYNEL